MRDLKCMDVQKEYQVQLPGLITERLLLRRLEQTDAADFVNLRCDILVNQYLNRPKTITMPEAKAYIDKIENGLNKKWFYWAICLKDNPMLIGTVCLWNFNKKNESADVGYELAPAFQGKGLMQEALLKIVEFGFETADFKRIIAYTHSGNERSKSLLQKAGFVRDLSLEKELHESDRHSNDTVYSLMHTTFFLKHRVKFSIQGN